MTMRVLMPSLLLFVLRLLKLKPRKKKKDAEALIIEQRLRSVDSGSSSRKSHNLTAMPKYSLASQEAFL
jgi:hypothetical protein